MITVEYKMPKGEGKYEIMLEGHAGYDESGKDIVCSAVSVLIETLAIMLEKLGCMETDISLMPGLAHVICDTSMNTEKEREIQAVFEFTAEGIEALAASYEKNIFFKKFKGLG